MKSLSHVRLLGTPWTAAYQAPPPMGFSRQHLVTTGRLCHLRPPPPGSQRGGHDTQALSRHHGTQRTLPSYPCLKPWSPSVTSRAPGPSARTGLLVGQAALLRAHRPCPPVLGWFLRRVLPLFQVPHGDPFPCPYLLLSKDGKACRSCVTWSGWRLGVLGFLSLLGCTRS